MDWSNLNYNLNIEEDNLEFLDYRRVGHCHPDGVQYAFMFPNGYGASVVKVPGFSQGSYSDSWELGVTRYDLWGQMEKGKFRFYGTTEELAEKYKCYPGDVIGCLDDETVNEILRDLRAL